MQLLVYDCGFPRWSTVFTLPNAIFFYYLFYDFYNKAYPVPPKNDKNANQITSNGCSKLANGQTNAHDSKHANGHANGKANGHANGQANGHVNGQANGHANGQANGKGAVKGSSGKAKFDHLNGCTPNAITNSVKTEKNGIHRKNKTE